MKIKSSFGNIQQWRMHQDNLQILPSQVSRIQNASFSSLSFIGWTRPQEVPIPNSYPKQEQLWGQNRLLIALSSLVLTTCKGTKPPQATCSITCLPSWGKKVLIIQNWIQVSSTLHPASQPKTGCFNCAFSIKNPNPKSLFQSSPFLMLVFRFWE